MKIEEQRKLTELKEKMLAEQSELQSKLESDKEGIRQATLQMSEKHEIAIQKMETEK